MIRVIDGHRYLMRDKRPTSELRKLHTEFCNKYSSGMDFHEWLYCRGEGFSPFSRSRGEIMMRKFIVVK